MKKIFILIIITIALFSLVDIASTATFCVDTAQELQDALTTAQSNGQNDTIHIVQGTYIGNFVYESTQAHSLTIEGGYTAGCGSRVVNAANTVLDGNCTGRVLMLNSPSAKATYIVNGITITRGELFYEYPTDPEPGGGLFVDTQSGSLSLANSIIIDNTTVGSQGGGIYVANAESVEITNAIFTRNTAGAAGGAGGGIFTQGVTGTINLNNNSFTDGWAFDGSGGVEIGTSGTINISNNTFTGNFSDMGSGAAYIYGTGTITMTNNIISHNTSDIGYGSGVFIAAFGTLNFSNNTVAYNNTPSASPALVIELGSPGVANIVNNIILGNYSGGPGWEDDLSVVNPAGTTVNLFNNDFDQSPTGFSITNPLPIDPSNLDNVDPLFVNAEGRNFHLKSNSPVIDMGSNAAPGLPDYDIDGLPRILYGTVDMGAYEYSSGNCTLTANKAGSGSGSITGDGLSCGASTCTGTYICGVSVTISASASTGSTFNGWSGCDSTDGNTCSVTMTSDKTVVATFTLIPPDTRVLVVEKTGSGTVTGTGIDCGTDCAQAYDDGTIVTLTASPGAGYTFSGWSGGGCSGTDICEVTMNTDVTVTAAFTPTDGKQYKLKAKKARKNKGDGTITSNDGNIDCGDTCMYAYPTGTAVTLSAAANEGSTFIGWKPATLNCSGTDPCTVTVDKAKSVQAVFVGDYTLKVVNKSKKEGTGTVTSIPIVINCTTGSTTDCTALYGYGETVTLSASADTGSVFTGWSPAKLCPGIDVCVVPMDKKRSIMAIFSGP